MMRKWISYSFIILATVILIGHSLVPHIHRSFDELTVISKTRKIESSVGFLGRFFALDTGERHLENYQQIIPVDVQIASEDDAEASNVHFSIVENYLAVAEFILIGSEHTQSDPHWYELSNVIHTSILISDSPLRAPPYC
ncbi:hypothetical protein [Chondrinema litorale]|uniref:hypothetical protein n=1 Tax=Chondrinema litorale TaxID=2994555 RepID=UPI002542A131|nr:hypothetical protein [Chondrinema litorale]UZR93068.1 hypothetical protein OQ292_14495 [Chondrinema litorale]